MPTETKSRSFEMTLAIDAPRDRVWKALTDPEELVRWFPLEARVTPGEGGEIHLGWAEGVGGPSKILAWDEGKHLRTGWFNTMPDGTPIPERTQLAVDYRLESDGGKTVLRVVNSGFLEGAAWDEELEGVTWGWNFELRSLRHYLEHHLGKQRHVATARIPVKMDRDAASRKLWTDRALLAGGKPPKGDEGDSYDITLATGERMRGEILYSELPRQFAGTATDHGNGLFRALVEKCSDELESWLWLSTWGRSADETEAMAARWRGLLEGLYPQ